jgi:hypothetical protein
MPKEYWIASVDIADEEKYKAISVPEQNPSTSAARCSLSVVASSRIPKAQAVAATR